VTVALPATASGRPSFAWASSPLLVEATNVSRTFGRRVALSDVSIGVRAGEIHALLGPNGAGKTTLLRILCGLVGRSGGTLQVVDRDPSASGRAFRSSIGLVPASDRSFYLRLSGIENLVFFGRLQGMRHRAARARARELLGAVGLDGAERLRVGNYSQGMQKRLAIARALLTDPRVLLVDEATHDLDPEGARVVRALVADAAEGGAAVVWATQRLDEIVGFANRVTLLDRGASRFSGSVHDLMGLAASQRYVVRLAHAPGRAFDDGDLAAAIGSKGTIERVRDGSGVHYTLAVSDGVALGEALTALAAVGAELTSCERERSQVEEAFLLLTGSATG